ncbi:MAG: prolipoprotein diacylglyceryl transferase family protein, partial [Bacteroidota bacterium]
PHICHKVGIYGIARHPAQLYEAIYCVVLFLLLFYLWANFRHNLPEGFVFGLFLALLWALRFADEFFKENQVAFEDGLPLNMGQILSIPLFLVGILVMIYSFKKGKKPEKTIS